MEKVPGLNLFPSTAEVNNQEHLTIGGCDTVQLAADFGTPLYLFDEADLRGKCAEFKDEFGRRYADTIVIYAAKAFINRALAIILKEEGLGATEIAKRLKIVRSSVYRVLAEAS